MANTPKKSSPRRSDVLRDLAADIRYILQEIAVLKAGKLSWLVGVSALLLVLLYVDNRFRGVEATMTQVLANQAVILKEIADLKNAQRL